MNAMLSEILDLIYQTKKAHPLIHCLTNPLTANDCANIILTVGGHPIMAQHLSEIEAITKSAKALVINIGGITDKRIEAIMLSGKAAKEAGIPIIFDPVGAAGSSFRLALAQKILEELSPAIIKGNMSEIKALSNIQTDAAGVDASPLDQITDENTQAFSEIVRALACRQNAVIVATGKTDIVADKNSLYLIKNGNEMLSKVTGTGCMCTSLAGVFAHSQNMLTAAAAAVTLMGIAGELAAEACKGIGSFKVSLFDSLYNISETIIRERSHIIEKH